MPTDTNVTHLVINRLSNEQYETAVKSDSELWLTPEQPASTTTLGPVKVDGTSITADADGTLHASTQLVVDSALSSTSTNPVQNKVVKAAIDAKQDTITAGTKLSKSGSTLNCTVSDADNVTIVDASSKFTAVGVKTKNSTTTYKFDWVGTAQEYIAGTSGGTIDSSWFCYITDDQTNGCEVPYSNPSDFNLYDPDFMYTFVQTTQGVTLNAPMNVTATWSVCYMKNTTAGVKMQSVIRLDDPGIRLTRCYVNNAWSDWKFMYGVWYPGT